MSCCGWGRETGPATVPAASAPGGPAEVVARHRAVTESELEAVAAGRPLCRPGPGAERLGLKGAEGRMVAVADVARALRRSPGSDPVVVVVDTLHRWRADAARPAAVGREWQEYHAGGIAELEELAADLRALPCP